MKQFNLGEYLKNPSRKVVTGDGRKVRILCTDAKSSTYHPIITLVKEPTGSESIVSYTEGGQFYSCMPSKEDDLFFVIEKKEGWVNVYNGGEGNSYIGNSPIFKSKEDAKKAGEIWEGYIATIKIEWEE